MAIAHRFQGLRPQIPCPAATGFLLFLKTLFPIRNLSLISLQNQSSVPLASELAMEHDSSTVTYLIRSCGLSEETAISVSQKVRFRSTEKPKQVLSLLRAYCFSEHHISNLIRKRPRILLANPENTLLPKLQFFLSIGMSKTDLAKIISPSILTRSLKNQFLPCYNLLKSVLLTDDKIVHALKLSTYIFRKAQLQNLIPNIAFLREFSVAQNCISSLLTHFPETVMQKHEEFRRSVEEVKEMGFDPKKMTFVLAARALSWKGEGNKTIWNRRTELYKNWGWSRDDILEAFKRQPHCMILSEKNIVDTMDFFVNKMGFPSRSIAKCPTLLCYSLEKRIIPRCSVIQVLSSKGLIKEDLSLATVIPRSEKSFLQRFVTKYEDQVPKLLAVRRTLKAWR